MGSEITISFFRSGLLRQPKWGHLKDLHRAIKLCEPALISGDPTVTSLGNYEEVRFTSIFEELFISSSIWLHN